MVKATTTRVIAFDFDEALNFEGETGPYLQYSLVREAQHPRASSRPPASPTAVSAAEVDGAAGRALERRPLGPGARRSTADRARRSSAPPTTLELSLLARHALELARKFHAIYHRHPILHEDDPALRQVRLAANAIFRRGLESLMAILGIPVPERM